MTQKYDPQLVKKIQEKQYKEIKRGVEVIVKPIPDSDIKGAMDPRLHRSMKKVHFLMKWIPKSLMKIDMGPKTIQRLRKMFNSVDSTSMVNETIEEVHQTVQASDGYAIPITIFKSQKTIPNAPILYFIHGGGFLAGRTEVVAEALRLFVANTGMIAVGVDYRLAPENPYPVGHTDCFTVLKWLGLNAKLFGGDSQNIFVGGDSAGGNLTLYCSNQDIEEGTNLIRGQILLYPTVNMGGIKDKYTTFTMDDIDMYEKHEALIRPSIEMFSQAQEMFEKILGTNDIMNKDLTPYVEVSEKSPVTMISSGEHDFLTIESLAYAKKLKDHGVDVTFTYYCGLGHAYIDNIGNYPQAEDCMIDIANFIRRNKV